MKSRGYWTYERCKEIVSKYKTKKDLYKNDGSVYVTITRNKWFDLIENLEISTNDIFKRLIYVYEFSDNHCYIGLTYNIEKRNKQHLGLSKGENSQVFKHMSKYGIKPKLVIKSDKIYVNDAIKMERDILNEYILNGWYILNIAKTGSIGGFSKFDIDKCIKQLERCKSLKEFREEYKSDYQYILKHKLYYENINIKELMDIKRNNPLNSGFNDKEKCRNESLKYKTRTSLQKGSKSAYNNAWKNGWLDEFYPK